MSVNAAARPGSSHFALWWSLETRTDLLASCAALGVGLAAIGLLALV